MASRRPAADLVDVLRPPPRLTCAQLIERGQNAEREGQAARARECYEMALALLADEGQGARASELLRWVARTHQVEANVEAALDCLAAARAVAEAMDDPAALGHAVNLEAIVHYQSGDLDRAEQLYVEASGHAALAGDEKLAAMTAQNLGVIASIRGDSAGALQHYTVSLASYRKLGLSKDVCVALNNLGLLAMQRGDHQHAEREFLEAMQISVLTGDLSARIVLDVNLAELLLARRDLERAQGVVEHALQLIERTGDTSSLAQATKVSGVIARETGAWIEAERQLRRAEELAVQRHDLLLEAEIARESATLERQQGRNRQVLEHLNRAHRLFAQLRAGRELADIDRRSASLELEFTEVARQWGDSIEAKDHYTQGHCVRVADLACEIAAAMGLDTQTLFWFRIGALLHDVGKLMVPAEVLNKPGRLTPAEWALMRSHTTAGVQMLSSIEFPWDVRPVVLSHHERWDGTGYPSGLAGEAIPLVARILCVADIYDALTSVRSYKRAMSHEAAMANMRGEIGQVFDPRVFIYFEEAMAARLETRESAAHR